MLKAIDETKAAMIYDEIINLDRIREIFKLNLLRVLRNLNNRCTLIYTNIYIYTYIIY